MLPRFHCIDGAGHSYVEAMVDANYETGCTVQTVVLAMPVHGPHGLSRCCLHRGPWITQGCAAKNGSENLRPQTDSVFNRYNIVSQADIADAARKIEEGAKAALKVEIHSSFIAELMRPGRTTEHENSRPDRKSFSLSPCPVYFQSSRGRRDRRCWKGKSTKACIMSVQ